MAKHRLGDRVVAQQVFHRLGRVAGKAQQRQCVDCGVHHQIVWCVNRCCRKDFVPASTATDDLAHGRGVERRRRLLESRSEFVESHTGGYVDTVQGVRHDFIFGRLDATCHGIPQDPNWFGD
jgi:hypothetical protein